MVSGIDTTRIEKILKERHGWDRFPLDSPRAEGRKPNLSWELETVKEEDIMDSLKEVIEKVKLLQTVLKYEIRDAIVQEEVDDKVEKILDDLHEIRNDKKEIK